MADKIKQAPWWLGLALAVLASFQQWSLQNNQQTLRNNEQTLQNDQQLESANGEAIWALIEALGECQEGR